MKKKLNKGKKMRHSSNFILVVTAIISLSLIVGPNCSSHLLLTPSVIVTTTTTTTITTPTASTSATTITTTTPTIATNQAVTTYHNKDNDNVIDWWYMFRHDLAHTGYSTSYAPRSNYILWQNSTEGAIWSSPAVVDEIVYIGTDAPDNQLYAFDALTGEKLWSIKLGTPESIGQPIKASPAVVDGMIYIGCYGSPAYFYAIYSSNHSIAWKFQVVDAISSSAVVYEEYVYFGSRDKKFYALNRTSGELKWYYDTSQPGDIFGIRSSPAVALDEGIVYVGSDTGILYAFDYDGFIDGTDEGNPEAYPVTSESAADIIWQRDLGTRIVSSPAVAESNVYIGTDDGYVYALNSLNGSVVWTSPYLGGAVRSSPAIDILNRIMVIGTRNSTVVALNLDNGEIIWSYKTGDWVDSSPAIASGVVFVGSYDWHIYALDEFTGELIWKYNTYKMVKSSPAVANGRVFVGSENCTLVAFGAPELKITKGDISFSDPEPYETELIEIKVIVHNFGSVSANAKVEYYYANYDNSVRGAIGTDWVKVDANSVSISTIDWQVPELPDIFYPTWTIYVRIRETIPPDSDLGNNDAMRVLSVKMLPRTGWCMFRHDHEHTGTTLEEQGADSNRTLWVFTAPPPTTSTSSLQTSLSSVVTSQAEERFFVSISSPLVTNHYVFIGTLDGKFYAIDEYGGGDGNDDDGTTVVRWYYHIGGKVIGTPAAIYGKVFVYSSNGFLYALDQNGIADGNDGPVLTENTTGGGDVIWSFYVGGDSSGGDGTAYNSKIVSNSNDNNDKKDKKDDNNTDNYELLLPSIVAAQGIIYICNPQLGIIYALDEDDGTKLWQLDIGAKLQATPAISTVNNVLAVATVEGELFVFNLTTLATIWNITFDNTNIISSPVLTEKFLVIADLAGTVYTFELLPDDQDDGIPDNNDTDYDIIWKYTVGGNIISTPAIVKDLIIVSALDGRVYALELYTGKLRWQSIELGAELYASPTVGVVETTPTLTGSVFIGTTGGKLYALPLTDPNKDGIISYAEILWQTDLSAPILSCAVIDTRYLFVVTDTALYAFGAPNRPPVAIITSPLPNSSYLTTDSIIFDATDSYDPDQDKLIYTWTSDLIVGKILGTVPKFERKIEVVGEHKITLIVTDINNAFNTTTVDINVYKPNIAQYLSKVSTPAGYPLNVSVILRYGGSGSVNIEPVDTPPVTAENWTWLLPPTGIYVAINIVGLPIVDWMNISVEYRVEELPLNYSPEALRLYYWDDTEMDWILCPETGSLPNLNQVWANFSRSNTLPSPLLREGIYTIGLFDNHPPELSVIEFKKYPNRPVHKLIVKYQDADNDFPLELKLKIDTCYYEFEPVDIYDYDVRDGKLYQIEYIYLRPGSYLYEFQVHDGKCSALAIYRGPFRYQVANTKPVADAGADKREVFIGEILNFYGYRSYDPDDDLNGNGQIDGYEQDNLSYSWDFNEDGIPDVRTRDASYKYTHAGTYRVTLYVTDGELEAIATVFVIVVPRPIEERPPAEVEVIPSLFTTTGLLYLAYFGLLLALICIIAIIMRVRSEREFKRQLERIWRSVGRKRRLTREDLRRLREGKLPLMRKRRKVIIRRSSKKVAEEEKVTEVAEEYSPYVCESCGTPVSEDTEECPECGRKFEISETVFECSNCGTTVSADALECPNCRARFT